MAERRTVLIVDDQESIVTALKRTLESEQYDILSALSGSEPLELIASRKYEDDIFFSGYNGFGGGHNQISYKVYLNCIVLSAL